MNPIAQIFRKTEAQVSPHEAGLAAWNANFDAARTRIDALQTALAGTVARRSKAAAAEARLEAINTDLISARAAVEIGKGSAERVHSLSQARTRAEAELRPLQEDAKVATLVGAEHQAVLTAAVAEQRALMDQWPSLAVPVLHEQGKALAMEYAASLDAFLSVAVRAFGIAQAADTISKTGGVGVFCGSGRLPDLVALLNVHPAFDGFATTRRDIYAEAKGIADSVVKALTT